MGSRAKLWPPPTVTAVTVKEVTTGAASVLVGVMPPKWRKGWDSNPR